MESKQRGRIPWSLVAVLGAGFMWACSGDALHMIGDAAVDIGETLRDASCAMAQDGGECEEAVGHGSVAVVCDQVATWTTPVAEGGVQRTTHFALVDVPTRNVQIELCRDTPLTCDDCTGTLPPARTCELQSAEFVGEQVYVECETMRSERVVW